MGVGLGRLETVGLREQVTGAAGVGVGHIGGGGGVGQVGHADGVGVGQPLQKTGPRHLSSVRCD